jgi:MipA family protein
MIYVFSFLILFFHSLARAEIKFQSPEPEPIWEYGVGAGFVRFEQYPAAGKYSQLILPFPTFQYRGRSLRADDREGAKAYLWKNDQWSVEMSGTGSPSLNSDDNEIRKGMKDLPWVIALGPKLVFKTQSEIQMGLGIFQAVTTDFSFTQFSGVIFQSNLTYKVERFIPLSFLGSKDSRDSSQLVKSLTHYFLTLKWESQEIQNEYFGVGKKYANNSRPEFRAKAGFLSAEASVFQSFKVGRYSYYLGANYADYSQNQNKKSPLFKSHFQMNYLFGITYVLGESHRSEVKEEDTRGLINRKFD